MLLESNANGSISTCCSYLTSNHANCICLQNVGPLPDYLEDAMKTAYNRYVTYLDSFGPDEAYLRKKVENELGTKMIHLKMRCSGIGSEWGKVRQFVFLKLYTDYSYEMLNFAVQLHLYGEGLIYYIIQFSILVAHLIYLAVRSIHMSTFRISLIL